LSLAAICAVVVCFHASLFAAPAGSYAVVVSGKTHADKSWRAVVYALVARHGARVVVYASHIDEARI